MEYLEHHQPQTTSSASSDGGETDNSTDETSNVSFAKYPLPVIIGRSDFLKAARKRFYFFNKIEGASEYAAQILKYLTKCENDDYCSRMVFAGGVPLYSITKTSSPDVCGYVLLKNISYGKKITICFLKKENSKYVFLPPTEITFSFELPIKKPFLSYFKKNDFPSLKLRNELNLHLDDINLDIFKEMLLVSKKDYSFIKRFNDEMYYRHICNDDGFLLHETDVESFYLNSEMAVVLGLSRKDYRSAFISLYAIEFYGLSLKDIYTIDSVFETGDFIKNTRRIDRLKQAAGLAVFNIIRGRYDCDFSALLIRCGETIKTFSVPNCDPENFPECSKNYPLIFGIAILSESYSYICSNFLNIVPELPREERKRLFELLKTSLNLSSLNIFTSYCKSITDGNINKHFFRQKTDELKTFLKARCLL